MNNLISEGYSAYIFVLLVSTVLFGGFLFSSHEARAQYGSSCSEYGIMAYESGGYCKCMSGYVFNTNIFGDKECVSADSVCRDEYGIMSRYDSLSGSCECSYGYVLGKDSIGRTQCISDDDVCQNQLGYHARATFGGQCECSYGYVIDNGQCVDGDQVCHSDHGYNSSYNSLSNKCECDDDYTFDDDYQCVKKQHNVYFKLLDINPENDKELLIKSDYDYRMYIVRVGVGCLGTSIARYEGNKLVVNLGTDYDVDMFDTVVLQDHDQTCSIMHRERTYDDSFPEPEEDDLYYYYTPTETYTPPVKIPEPVPDVAEEDVSSTETSADEVDIVTETSAITISEDEIVNQREVSTSSDTTETFAPEESTKNTEKGFFKRILNFFKGLFG